MARGKRRSARGRKKSKPVPPGPGQKPFWFAPGQPDYDERLRNLGDALEAVDASTEMWMFMRLIFDKTVGGLKPWAIRPEDIAGQRWAPRVKERGIYRLLEKARTLRFIVVRKNYGSRGHKLPSEYLLNWEWIEAASRLPAAPPQEGLTDDDESLLSPVTVGQLSPVTVGTPSVLGDSRLLPPGPGSSKPADAEGGHAPARAPLARSSGPVGARRVRNPQQIAAEILAYDPAARKEHGAKESKEESNLSLSQRGPPKETKETNGSIEADGAPDPTTVGELVAQVTSPDVNTWRKALAANAAYRSAEIVRIKTRVIKLAQAPDDWWVAGKIADFVVRCGFPVNGREDPDENLERILGGMLARKSLPREDGGVGSPMAWLQQVFGRIVRKKGFPWSKADREKVAPR